MLVAKAILSIKTHCLKYPHLVEVCVGLGVTVVFKHVLTFFLKEFRLTSGIPKYREFTSVEKS